MTGFAPKYFLIIFGLLFVAYYPIAIGMAIYVGVSIGCLVKIIQFLAAFGQALAVT